LTRTTRKWGELQKEWRREVSEHREDGEGGTEKDDSEEDKGEAQEGGRS